jgi:hypothetical protein
MGRALVVAAAVSAAALAATVVTAAPISSAAPGVHPGEVLVYEITIEIQLHAIPGSGSTQPPVAYDSAVQGTETITGLRADADGTAHDSVSIALHGKSSGQAMVLQRTITFKVAPDGSIHAEGKADAATTQYLAYIGEAAKRYSGHPLRVGEVFHDSVAGPSGFANTISTTSTVVGEKQYRGYPTFAIETTGSAKLNTAVAGTTATGTVSAAGTTYYDQTDQLLIGEAMRSNVDATLAGPQGGHINAVTTINLVLDSRTHVTAPPPTAAPTSAPSPTPPPTPTSTPTPADQYYTPTPAAPTPSPVVVPYPQHT